MNLDSLSDFVHSVVSKESFESVRKITYGNARLFVFPQEGKKIIIRLSELKTKLSE